MKRDVMKEWTHALSHTNAARRGAWAQVFETQRRDMTRFEVVASPGGLHNAPATLRSTRPLRVSDTLAGKKADVERAVLILQRHNRLLRARFGVEWPAAASVLCGEAARRSMSVASLARVLTSGLRRDAREGGAR
ncbi:MAG TPA: hypothetical protein VEZ14_03800 [Dehalococcoidia bacterium]|nr:hypothetical protein [Dehalococcoidia bacterium]